MNCPLLRGFVIRILYETNLFLKKCPLKGGVRYREISLYIFDDSSYHLPVIS